MTDHYTLEQAAKDVAHLPTKPPIVVLEERIRARSAQIDAALKGQGVATSTFIRALLTSATINPELQACTWASLWLECLKACRDGLLPDGREGVIVPFKSRAQWIPMYQGLLKKFRQSGQCQWIGSYVVRSGEPFEHLIDERGEHFKHVPGNDDAPVVKVYAAALTKDGAFYTAILSMNDINKIKTESRAAREDAPWKKWPEEMMKKTALRRLAKMLPSGYYVDEEDMVAIHEAPTLVPSSPMVPYEQRHQGQQGRQRPADALDQFANAPQTGGSSPGDATVEQDAGGESGAHHAAPDDTAGVSSDDPIEIAYRHGMQAKADGLNRRAIPGEYRGEDRSREAMAWQAGHDGKAKPEWAP